MIIIIIIIVVGIIVIYCQDTILVDKILSLARIHMHTYVFVW